MKKPLKDKTSADCKSLYDFLTEPPPGLKNLKTVSVQFPEEIYENIKDLAERQMRSLSAEIVFAVQAYVRQLEVLEKFAGKKESLKCRK